MGEVYRARDTRLDRQVAIKVLPESMAADGERIARFEREARLLATLSHQNIAGIYGLEQSDATRYLVLELIEGETLADRLASGSLPVEETLRLCRQIAEGVASAHERGVLHRDLKPANIKITLDDSVKVLDFGIAKAFDAAGSTTGLAEAPTMTQSHHTAVGAVVGTPSYMSPEQARGKTVDKRTDVWSFGCLMYECLAGQIAFGGETATDAIARILERDPDFALLPANTPPTVQLLLRRCLQKDRRKRLHDIEDARVVIEEAISDPEGTTLGLRASSLELSTPSRRSWLPWLLTAALAITTACAVWFSMKQSGGASLNPALTTHLALVAPGAKIDWERGAFDLSPDGRMLAYMASPDVSKNSADAPHQIFLRRFDRPEATVVGGTERVVAVAFSPSGEWIAFLALDRASSQSRSLKLVKVDGTPPVTIANLGEQNYWDVSWLSAETLLLSGWGSTRIYATISADGGDPQPIQLDTAQLGDHIGVEFHTLLPGGRMALGSVFRKVGMTARSDAVLITTDGWTCSTLLENADGPVYAPSGHLVFKRDRSLLAAPFDLDTGSVTGRVIPLLSGVGEYRLSATGTLAYHPVAGSLAGRQLFTVDAQGNANALSPVQRAFRNDLCASSDGRWLAAVVYEGDDIPGVWAYELGTGLIRLITPGEDPCFLPRLSPDGQHLAYTRWAPDKSSLMVSPIDGSQDPRDLISMDLAKGFLSANCWSSDSTQLLVGRLKYGNSDILRIPFAGGEPEPLLASSATEAFACISSDGGLLAYLSNESGEASVYVRRVESQFASLGTKQRVTSKIGPPTIFWSHDANTVYFVDKHQHLMAVDVTTEPELSVSLPKSILDLETLRVADDALAPLPDGRIAFIRKGEQETEAKHLNIILNWFDELSAKVPVR